MHEEAIKAEREGKYRHWDILRHLTPPQGLTSEEWWAGIKMHRVSRYKNVPLVDVKNSGHFVYNLTDSVLEELHKIDLGAGGSITFPEKIINSHTRDQYIVRSLIEESITSSQIEGAATTRSVAKEMIRSGRPPRDNSERMILNNFYTMQKIAEWKSQPLSWSLVQEIHRCITQDTLENPDGVGRFRNSSERVVVEEVGTGNILYTPPPANELAHRMEMMCDFANGKSSTHFIHPVIRAIILHFWLAYDHPFVDGNGRVARALFYWLILRSGYWLFEFISISEIILKATVKYGEAFLYTESDQNDLTYFIVHQIDVIKKSIESLYKYIEKKSKQLNAVDGLLKDGGGFNRRQEELLYHALRHPGAIYTIQAHKLSQRVAYDTARKDLLGLYENRYLEKEKRGKEFVFVAPSDLLERMNKNKK
ncbi:MAG: Fic family protein [Chlamydiia bacterium]|nr:Fic family protein [Chlamydiia bacterium]